MSKGMELNGNVLSGDTYGAREYIKDHWDGKWNADTKTWTVDPEKVVKTISEKSWGFTRVLEIVAKIEIGSAPKVHHIKTHGVDGWCSRCQDWTYGDCGHKGA